MCFLKRSIIVLVVLAMGGAFLFWAYNQKPSSEVVVKEHIDEKGTSSIGGAFDLIDQFGHVRHDHEFRGKMMMVYFVYSYCPDICPMALSAITNVLKSLGRDRDQVVSVFITCDPKRDTIENLKIYSQNYDPNIIMLTGSELKIERAKKAYKVYSKEAAKKENMNDYLIDHSSAIYLMDRDGHFVQMFPHNVDPSKIMRVLQPYLIQKQ